MPKETSGNARQNFLVRARHSTALAQVIGHIEADPSIAIERRVGAGDGLETLVVSMSESQAALLRQRFPGEVIVESDQPLTLY